MTIRIGTSGWVYKHWRGIFYPPDWPPRNWFAYYAREFDTIEINNSFYRLPSETAFDAWREQAPPNFLYAVKASRFITHLKKLKDPNRPLDLFFARAKRLGEMLGPVLFQLPPHWGVDPSRFENFLSVLPEGQIHVVEFRDPSWLIEEVFRLMERYQVAHCIHDFTGLEVPLRVTAATIYIRFHGDPVHGGNYTPGALEVWAKRMAKWHGASGNHNIFAYFNNDVSGYALKNAKALKEMLSA